MPESAPYELVYGTIFHDRADSWVDVSFTRTTDPDGVPIRLGNWTVDPGETTHFICRADTMEVSRGGSTAY